MAPGLWVSSGHRDSASLRGDAGRAHLSSVLYTFRVQQTRRHRCLNQVGSRSVEFNPIGDTGAESHGFHPKVTLSPRIPGSVSIGRTCVGLRPKACQSRVGYARVSSASMSCVPHFSLNAWPATIQSSGARAVPVDTTHILKWTRLLSRAFTDYSRRSVLSHPARRYSSPITFVASSSTTAPYGTSSVPNRTLAASSRRAFSSWLTLIVVSRSILNDRRTNTSVDIRPPQYNER